MKSRPKQALNEPTKTLGEIQSLLYQAYVKDKKQIKEIGSEILVVSQGRFLKKVIKLLNNSANGLTLKKLASMTPEAFRETFGDAIANTVIAKRKQPQPSHIDDIIYINYKRKNSKKRHYGPNVPIEVSSLHELLHKGFAIDPYEHTLIKICYKYGKIPAKLIQQLKVLFKRHNKEFNYSLVEFAKISPWKLRETYGNELLNEVLTCDDELLNEVLNNEDHEAHGESFITIDTSSSSSISNSSNSYSTNNTTNIIQPSIYQLLVQFDLFLSCKRFDEALQLYSSSSQIQQFYTGDLIDVEANGTAEITKLADCQLTYAMMNLLDESPSARTLYSAILFNFRNGDMLRRYYQQILQFDFPLSHPHLIEVAYQLNQLRYSSKHICYFLPSPERLSAQELRVNEEFVKFRLPHYLHETFAKCWLKFRMGMVFSHYAEDGFELIVNLKEYQQFWNETVDITLQQKFQMIHNGNIDLFLPTFLPAPHTFNTILLLSPEKMEIIGPYLCKYAMGFVNIEYINNNSDPYFKIDVIKDLYTEFYNFVMGMTFSPNKVSSVNLFAPQYLQQATNQFEAASNEPLLYGNNDVF